MKSFINGAWRDVPAGRVFVGGSWRLLTRAVAFSGGSWRTAVTFTPALSVSVQDVAITVGSKTPQSISVNVPATPAGGIPPYTYVWTKISGAGALYYPTNAQATVTATVSPGSQSDNQLSVTVTDSVGTTATGTCVATLENFGSGF